MKLSFEQIKSITKGVVRIEEQADGIHFFKCTEKQLAAHEADNRLGAALTTTGVRLDFHTDSGHLSFRAAGGKKFEILVNNEIYKRFFSEEEGFDVACTLPQGEKRITVALPSHYVGIIKDVELDDGASVKPHTYATKLLFIGDSITQGWNSVFDTNSFAWRVTRHYDADSIINGIGGTVHLPAAVDNTEFRPDMLLTALGCNDFGRYQTLDELKSAVSGVLGQLKEFYRDAKLVTVLPTWRADDETPRSMGMFAQCRSTIREIAEGFGYAVIDGYELIPHVSELFADTVHPNDMGFELFAKNLIKALDELKG